MTGVAERTLGGSEALKVVALADVGAAAIDKAKERLHCPDAKIYADHLALSRGPEVDWVRVEVDAALDSGTVVDLREMWKQIGITP